MVVDALAGAAAEEDAASCVEDISVIGGVVEGADVLETSVPVAEEDAVPVTVVKAPPSGPSVKGKNKLAR